MGEKGEKGDAGKPGIPVRHIACRNTYMCHLYACICSHSTIIVLYAVNINIAIYIN